MSGTKGSLHIADFVLPFFGCESSFEVIKPAFDVNGCDFNMQGHRRRLAVNEYSNSFANSQENEYGSYLRPDRNVRKTGAAMGGTGAQNTTCTGRVPGIGKDAECEINSGEGLALRDTFWK